MEAPPGIEPGMEVLQTSALPLGDGAPGGNRIDGTERPALRTDVEKRGPDLGQLVTHRNERATCSAGPSVTDGRTGPSTFQNLERETGFEPATSTLARSHSTTELFPPDDERNPNRGTVRASTRRPLAR